MWQSSFNTIQFATIHFEAGYNISTTLLPSNHPHFSHSLGRSVLVLVLVISLFSLLSLRAKPLNSNTICFYNAESNINNYISLKKGFDGYLSQFGNYTFQPFTNRVDFENYLGIKGGGIFILSSGHYRELTDIYDITPVLIGVNAGRTTHREVLVTKKSSANLEALRGKKIASANSKQYSIGLLKQMIGLGHPGLFASIRILQVPKDIDAMMTITFGMADAALATQESLDDLQSINPTQRNRLKTVAVSTDILLPVVAAMGVKNEALIKIMQTMGTTPEGHRRLRMLNLDGFHPLSVSERKRLEGKP